MSFRKNFYSQNFFKKVEKTDYSFDNYHFLGKKDL